MEKKTDVVSTPKDETPNNPTIKVKEEKMNEGKTERKFETKSVPTPAPAPSLHQTTFVVAGRDGKDGAVGPQGPTGKDGPMGPQGPEGPAVVISVPVEDKVTAVLRMDANKKGTRGGWGGGNLVRYEGSVQGYQALAPEYAYLTSGAAASSEEITRPWLVWLLGGLAATAAIVFLVLFLVGGDEKVAAPAPAPTPAQTAAPAPAVTILPVQVVNGRDGRDGAIGPEGPAGLDGAIGPEGPQGPKGDRGPAGKAGKNGAVGAIGPQGPAGQDGGLTNVRVECDGCEFEAPVVTAEQ